MEQKSVESKKVHDWKHAIFGIIEAYNRFLNF